MSRRLVLLVVLALSVAACSEAAEATSTTQSTPELITTDASTTTRPEVTETAETTTTTTIDETTTTSTGAVVTTVDIAVVMGIVEQVERFEVPLNGSVRVTVTADASDEIHLHGYDIHADVIPGLDAVFEFDATIPGIFEIELEGSGVLIGELQVAP